MIDAKFPLEAMTAWRGAATDDDRKQAIARVRVDMGQAHFRHRGEVPDPRRDAGHRVDVHSITESVYAGASHERFDDMMQRAQRARVMIVSPTLMVMA